MYVRSQSSRQLGSPLAAGIDVGTTALKAVLVDEAGNLVRRARLPSVVSIGPGDRLEHDALATWWEGPRVALVALLGRDASRPGGDVAPTASGSQLFQGGMQPPKWAEQPPKWAEQPAGWAEQPGQLAGRLRAVAVSAMMPSAAPVSEVGRPVGPGVLYGSAGPAGTGDPTSSDEMERLAALCAASCAGAYGYWPAQAVANASLGGAGVVDLASAFAAGQLFGSSGWDQVALARIGLEPSRMPRVAMFGEPLGELAPSLMGANALRDGGGLGEELAASPVAGAVLGAGSVDGLCEQLIAGAAEPGDVLITLGSTLVVWLCTPGWPEEVPPGLWRVPHVAPGMAMVGGASNAGGLWVDWVDRVLRPAGAGAGAWAAASEVAQAGDYDLRPSDVPIWWPWPRGERVPWHDGSLRVGLAGAHLSHGPANLRRAALEASAFVARLILDRAATCGTSPRRYFVSGGGAANRPWLQALAEVLGQAVVPMAVPEGAALGAAFLARMAAGLETSLADAARWARWGPPAEPRPQWAEAAGERFERWVDGLPAH